MPELPEVETVRRQILPFMLNQVIKDIVIVSDLDNKRYISTSLAKNLIIKNIRRRGKYLILDLGKKECIIHFAMTGNLNLDSSNYTRAIFKLEKDDKMTEIYFHDPRRFGKILIVDSGDYSALPTLKNMGKEPLEDFDLDEFTALLKTNSTIKTNLLSQKPVAGLGNIYADEALFYAKIHPTKISKELTKQEIEVLFWAIQKILQNAIDLGGSSLGLGLGNYKNIDGMGNYQENHQVYGREKQPCFLCRTPIQKIKHGGRGTHFCPNCQVLDK